jgi:hypothetical protein
MKQSCHLPLVRVSARPLGVRYSNLDCGVFEKDIHRFSREQILAVLRRVV